MNYYDILGVSEDASQQEIEEAYKSKVKDTHPDQSDHPNAAQLFMQVQEAYDILGDPEAREQYDKNKPGDTGAGTGETGTEDTETTQSTTKADDEGVGWRAHTRDTAGAEHIWENEYNHSDSPPHIYEIDQSKTKKKFGQGIMIISGGLLGLEIGLSTLSLINPDQFGLFMWTGLGNYRFLMLGIIFIILIIGVERFLETYRRILSLVQE